MKRIPGFDLARAYSIFGMYVVNFNIVYGNYQDPSLLSQFLNLFSGNASIAFVMLAGMGVSLLTWRKGISGGDILENAEGAEAEKRRLRGTIVKRSWFLFALGLALYPWWPGDILHFYGGYMHLAAFFLFVGNRWLLALAAACVAVFHALFWAIPYETGWNFETYQYLDFWSLPGFFRNTIYNGWNPIFPWAGLFFLGMWLGRLDWSSQKAKTTALAWAFAIFIPLEILIWMGIGGRFSPAGNFFFASDYVPPFLPFLASGACAAIILIVVCLWLGERFENQNWLKNLAATGQMTLSHYVIHLTLGMIALSLLSGQAYGKILNTAGTTSPARILAFSVAWFLGSVAFSYFWKKRFKNGPFEMLMRRVCG